MSRVRRFFKSLIPAAPQKTTRARLCVEALDQRDVPAIFMDGHILTITGDSQNDSVLVRLTGTSTSDPLDDMVKVTQTSWQLTAQGLQTTQTTKYFHDSTVSSISATLGNGANGFENWTDINCVVTGGTGKDTLSGGGGADILKGLGGDDTLEGMNGPDILYGGTGNDRLYGGSGNDTLFGESGTNGLYGGWGTDYLYGGTGSDRFLKADNNDYIYGYSSANDVKLVFDSTLAPIQYGSATFGIAIWTQDEVQTVDEALATLHEKTNSTVFLRYDGDDLHFRRVGSCIDGNADDVLGWNGDAGVITLTQKSFNGSSALVHEVVLHEIGHNWDESSENATIGEFQSLSNWLPSPIYGSLPGMAVSGDGNWSHKANAEFTRTYAKTNPKEDFAESFMTYWMHEMGEESTLANKHFADMPLKMAYMADFVAAVS